jgi:hypothetical protein
MMLQSFIDKYNGKFVEYNHDAYKFQCMDLMRQYVHDVLGINPYDAIPASPTARQCFQNFKSNKYFTKVINTPTGVPKKGDIVFWGLYPFVTGTAGHVAIFSGGNVSRFISFDQNYPTGQPCKFVNHSYRGVLGWLTARKLA